MDSFIEALKNLGVICLGMAPVGIGYLWLDCNWNLKLFARALCKFVIAVVGLFVIAALMMIATWIAISLFEALIHGSNPTEVH